MYDWVLDSIDKIYLETYGFTTKTLAQEFVYLGDDNKIIGAVGLSRLEENSPRGYLELFLTERESEFNVKEYLSARSDYIEFGSTGLLKEYRTQNIPLLFRESAERGLILGAAKGIGLFNILILRILRNMGVELTYLGDASIDSIEIQNICLTELHWSEKEIKLLHDCYFKRLSPKVMTIDLHQVICAIDRYVEDQVSVNEEPRHISN